MKDKFLFDEDLISRTESMKTLWNDCRREITPLFTLIVIFLLAKLIQNETVLFLSLLSLSWVSCARAKINSKLSSFNKC